METSLLKNIKGKMSIILKNTFSSSAGNGYYMKDQFKALKTIVNKGPSPWPEDGASRIVTYSDWLEEVKSTSESIKDLVTMSGDGVNGKALKTFKEQFKAKIEGAELTAKSVSVARKLAK